MFGWSRVLRNVTNVNQCVTTACDVHSCMFGWSRVLRNVANVNQCVTVQRVMFIPVCLGGVVSYVM